MWIKHLIFALISFASLLLDFDSIAGIFVANLGVTSKHEVLFHKVLLGENTYTGAAPGHEMTESAL